MAVGAGVALGLFLLQRSMTNEQEEVEPPTPLTWDVQTAGEFSESIEQPDMLVVNVHVPFEGELGGTDLNIAYNQIAGDPRLPASLDAPIAVYCRSGKMSTKAARALGAAGRSNVVELDGGMNAWRESGRPVVGER